MKSSSQQVEYFPAGLCIGCNYLAGVKCITPGERSVTRGGNSPQSSNPKADSTFILSFVLSPERNLQFVTYSKDTWYIDTPS